MAILPECQGKGLGRKLVDALIGGARDRRVNVALAGAPGTPCSIARMRNGSVGLTVTTAYSSGAVGFYKKLGFQEVTPPRMLADGTITGVSNLRKRRSSAYIYRALSSILVLVDSLIDESNVSRAFPWSGTT